MKYKPLLAITFLLFCIFQTTVTQEIHDEACDPERRHAERVFAMAKHLSLNCDQLPQRSAEYRVIEAFCESTRDREVNKARIATSTAELRKYMKICEKEALHNAKTDPHCKLMEKLEPRMELLYSEVSKLKCYWTSMTSQASTQPPIQSSTQSPLQPATPPTTHEPTQPAPQSAPKENCTNEFSHSEQVLVMAKRLLPYCDESKQGSLEFIVLEAFCDSTREQSVNETAIAESTMNLRKYMKMCEDPESHGSPKRRRCDLMRKMQPHMEELNKEAAKLKCNFKSKPNETTPPSTQSTVPPHVPLSWEQRRAHAREAFALAKRVLPDCRQLPQGAPENIILADFCNSLSDNMINKTKIAKASDDMKRWVNYVCEDDSFDGSRCKLMKKMQPKIELLNNEAMTLRRNWFFETGGDSKMDREMAQAEKAYILQMQHFPSFCDRLEPNTPEQTALAEFCDTTKLNAFKKQEIKEALGALQAMTSSICERDASIERSPRCELVNQMKLRMEQLNKLVTGLNDHWRYMFDPSTTIPEPQEEEEQQQTLEHPEQLTNGQQTLLICSALVIVVPLTVAFFCAIQLFLVFR